MKIRKGKILTLMLLLFTFIIGLKSDILAYTSSTFANAGDWSSVDWYNYSVDGHDNHSRRKYALSGVGTVFCVQPTVLYSGNVTYGDGSVQGFSNETRCKISYIIGQEQYDGQDRQAAIWSLLRGIGGLTAVGGSGDVNRVQGLINEANAAWNGSACIKGSGSGVSLSTTSFGFNYDGGRDAYVSDVFTAYVNGVANVTMSGYPNGAYMTFNGENVGAGRDIGGNVSIQIICPRTSFSGWHNVSVHAVAQGGTVIQYNPCNLYYPTSNDRYIGGKTYGQELSACSSSSYSVGGGDVYANGAVYRPLGNIQVGKLDAYNKLRGGAVFRVTGPFGFDQTITTTEGQYTTWYNVDCGTYYVQELTAPTNMIKNTVTASQNLGENQTVTITINNSYQRGSVRLTKFDQENRGATKGDAKISGAVFNLYAAQDIYEGPTKIYSANDLVRGNIVTKADGSTDAVTNLPIGGYYYKEITPSEGFNINGNNIPVTITYAGENASVAAEAYNEAPERPIRSNLKILKRLQATDYDAEINLVGARFKLTLNSDRSQVYYTTFSGADGLCEASGIPYGTYTVEECDVPASALKAPNFEVKFAEDGKTYDFTIVDTSKKIQTEVYKEMFVHEGEATDAVVEGAVFTLYTDAQCTTPYKDKDGNVVTIGPTDATGYAKSKFMRTGTYYLKETTFPRGVDPDAVIANENVTYRNKIYVSPADNAAQTTETAKNTLHVTNEPKRNKIEIIKKVEETSNTSKFPIDQCEFTATLKSTIGTDHVFSRKCTAETTRDTGYCVIEELPYGEYVVEETKVSPITLKCANFDVFVGEDKKVYPVGYKPADATKWYGTNPVDSEGSVVDVAKVIQIKVQKVDANRTEADAPDMTQGDASLYGAVYQIYRFDPMTNDFTEYVYDIVTDHKDADGFVVAESRDLLVGDYMVKEKVKNTEIVNGKEVKYSYAEGYLVDEETYYFRQKPEDQTVRISYHKTVSKEEVVRGSLKVIKYDNENGNHSTEVPSKGAILRLTLDSNPSVYYDCTIDGEGRGEFVEEKSMRYYPNTIPYGQYTITEVKESNPKEHTSWFIQSEPVNIGTQGDAEYRIESDEPVRFYLQIQKRDADNGAKVLLPGAKYKVWDVKRKEFVTQMIYPSGKMIDVFETEGNTGLVTLPESLEAGKFVIYEVDSPEGYYLEDKMRVPENAKDLGNPDVAGILIDVTKSSMKVVENEQFHKIDLFYVANVSDRPLKAKLEIEKTGEMLVDATSTTVKYGEEYTPVYKVQGLANVTYDIIAAEDIKSKDGTQVYITKGQKVDTITTNAEGYAITGELYVGEYRVVETKTPEGYLVDNNIPNVTLTSENKLQRINVINKKLNDVRQKLGLTFPKTFEEVNFSDSETLDKWAVFGVYNNADIKSVTTGKVVIPKNSLVDVITVNENNANVTSKKDVPAGIYTVRELDASYPYSISTEVRELTLSHDGHTKEQVVVAGQAFNNTYEKGSITLVKVSSSIMKNIVFNGAEMDKSQLDKQVEEFISNIQGMDKDEIAEYIRNTEVKCVGGAEYSVYTDEACTKPLYIKNAETGKFELAKIVTDETGLVSLENIPLRTYYLVETKAPENYELNKEKVVVTLTEGDKDSMVYNALVDDSTIGELIIKTDIFTGELVPNCEFEIARVVEDGEDVVLMHATTDKKGVAYIPTDIFENGKVYTYTELNAPDMYQIDTEPHSFTAKFDENGKWAVEKIPVTNIRKNSTVTLIKTDDENNLVPNCTFELKSEETGYYKKGTTDENGIYVFENVPYGKYTYTELEAPEEYILDTEPHDVVINGEDMKIVAYNVKAPDTSDINVLGLVAMFAISMVCILGIRKNKISKNV